VQQHQGSISSLPQVQPDNMADPGSTLSPLRQRPLIGPQPPVELHVTLGNAGTPKYPASHRPVQMLLTGLVGEQLKLPLVVLGGGRLHTADSSNSTTFSATL
jgi:hypothetical protein